MGAETEAIAADLAGVLDTLSRAEVQVGATVEHANQIAARAAGTGFVGVATAVAGLGGQIKAIGAGLTRAADSGREAVAAVGGVKEQMSPVEANRHLAVAKQKVDGVRPALATVVQQIATVKAKVGVVLQGGQPGPLLARLDAIRQDVTVAAQRSDAVNAKIATTIARGGQLGN